MMSKCGWIGTGRKGTRIEFLTSCSHVTYKHKGFVYCPYCGKEIKVLKEGSKC